MMINPANKKHYQEAKRNVLMASWKRPKITVIAMLSLLISLPAMASLVPPIELPNLDWVVNQSDTFTERPAGKSTAEAVSSLVNLSLDNKQNLIAQLSQEILADSREYINYPKIIFLSSLTSDKQSMEYLNTVVSQLEKVGDSQVPENVLKKGTRKQVIVSMRIDNQGKLLESSIQRSSDIIAIDKAALKIIELAAPYQSLPKSMSERYDQVDIVRTFFFDGEE